MGSDRRRLTRDDLEAMIGEFEIVERYGGTAAAVDAHLKQLRRSARLGVSLEDWAKAHGVPLPYARALRRYLDQE